MTVTATGAESADAPWLSVACEDNRGQTTVYLNHQTTLPTQALPTGVAYPIYLVPHAVPTPSLLVLQK
ncbi:MAG: hypothetical protein Q8N46_10035, partial [Anaerolineales bacterium]|nr:hypothetical protein [Anaerolineales bacterium]